MSIFRDFKISIESNENSFILKPKKIDIRFVPDRNTPMPFWLVHFETATCSCCCCRIIPIQTSSRILNFILILLYAQPISYVCIWSLTFERTSSLYTAASLCVLLTFKFILLHFLFQ